MSFSVFLDGEICFRGRMSLSLSLSSSLLSSLMSTDRLLAKPSAEIPEEKSSSLLAPSSLSTSSTSICGRAFKTSWRYVSVLAIGLPSSVSVVSPVQEERKDTSPMSSITLPSRSRTSSPSQPTNALRSLISLKARISLMDTRPLIPSSSCTLLRASQSTDKFLNAVPRSRKEVMLLLLSFISVKFGRRTPRSRITISSALIRTSRKVTDSTSDVPTSCCSRASEKKSQISSKPPGSGGSSSSNSQSSSATNSSLESGGDWLDWPDLKDIGCPHLGRERGRQFKGKIQFNLCDSPPFHNSFLFNTCFASRAYLLFFCCTAPAIHSTP
eukprot:28893_5